MQKPSVVISLDKRYAFRNGENKGKFQVKIWVTFTYKINGKKKWVQRPFKTGVYLTEKDYAMLANPRREDLKRARDKVYEMYNKAAKIIEDNTFINPDIFEKQFTGSGSYENLISVLQEIKEEKEADGSVGDAKVFDSAISSLTRFAGSFISFAEITEKWLNKYEAWMLKEGKQRKTKKGVEKLPASPATIGMYLRCARSAFNREIEAKRVPKDFYPFKSYQIPTSSGNKQSLDEDEKDRLRTFTTQDQKLRKSADFWIFSYLCYGMNMTDIARLRFADIQNDVIIITRHKTRNTNRSGRKMITPMHPECKEIITRWGAKSLNPNDYVFPVLRDGLTAKQEVERIQDFTKEINESLRAVAELLGFKKKLTTYIARHTFATLALRKGYSKDFVQDALGHAVKGPVGNYLHGFDVEFKWKVTMSL